MKAGKVTEQQRAMFDGLNPPRNVTVMSCIFQGQQVGVLTAIRKDADGSYHCVPVAILCDENFLEKHGKDLLSPNGEPLPKAE